VTLIYHAALTSTNIHRPYTWEYADSTARLAAAGFVAGDVGKFARQLNDNSFWLLTAVTPTWSAVGAVPMVDTKANILASTATNGKVGFSTDTLELFIADGSVWRTVPFALVSGNYDMGAPTDPSSIGYGKGWISDKTLNNTVIGSNGTASTGGVRVTTAGVFQVYLNGSWNTVVTNFVLREDATYGYSFEHMPIGFTQYLEIMTGQSLYNLGLNGYPITNAYKTSMGAYPPPPIIGGRSIY
jgi:hypothetical protein